MSKTLFISFSFPFFVWIVVLTASSCTKEQEQEIRTATDVAYAACELAAHTRLSNDADVKAFCSKAENLKDLEAAAIACQANAEEKAKSQ